MEECSQARPATYDIKGQESGLLLIFPRYLRQREDLAIEPLLAGQNRTIPVRQVLGTEVQGPELCFKQASATRRRTL